MRGPKIRMYGSGHFRHAYHVQSITKTEKEKDTATEVLERSVLGRSSRFLFENFYTKVCRNKGCMMSYCHFNIFQKVVFCLFVVVVVVFFVVFFFFFFFFLCCCCFA